MTALLTHWSAPPLAWALLALLAVHERGVRRLRPEGDGRDSANARRQAWLTRLALGWGAVCLASPLGFWSHGVLSLRAGLDLDFGCVVAPLLVLGAPWRPLVTGMTGEPPKAAAATAPAPVGPMAAGTVALAGFLAWHLPWLQDPTVHSAALRDLELASYLVAGVLLWLQIVGSHPFTPAWEPLQRITLIVAVLAECWIDGAAMIFGRTVWYPAFSHGPGAPLSPSMDQGLAGAITWVLPLFPFIAAAFWCFSEWIERDEADWELHWDGGHVHPAAIETLQAPGTDGLRD